MARRAAAFRALLPRVGELRVEHDGSALLGGEPLAKNEVLDLAQAFVRASYLVDSRLTGSR